MLVPTNSYEIHAISSRYTYMFVDITKRFRSITEKVSTTHENNKKMNENVFGASKDSFEMKSTSWISFLFLA